MNIHVRAVHQIDRYADNFIQPEVFQKYKFASHLGYAKDDSPVSYVAMGKGDMKGFVMSFDSFDLTKFSSLVIESDLRKVQEQKLKTGKEINEILYIVDMDGLSLREYCHKCVIEMGLDLFRMFQEHYPEIWKYVFIVNASTYFYATFNLFRPIFGKTFLQKFHVVSKEATPELLLRYVDADVLPTFLGGKRVDSNGDPMCSEFLRFGGPIPEKYYLRNRTPLLSTDPGAESFSVSPRGFHNHFLVVEESGSIITFEIRFEGGSVSVTTLYKPFASNPDKEDIPARDKYIDEQHESCPFRVVSPVQKLQAHLAPIDNSILAPWSGIYCWKFDNTSNWLTSRKIICRLKILPPGTVFPLGHSV